MRSPRRRRRYTGSGLDVQEDHLIENRGRTHSLVAGVKQVKNETNHSSLPFSFFFSFPPCFLLLFLLPSRHSLPFPPFHTFILRLYSSPSPSTETPGPEQVPFCVNMKLPQGEGIPCGPFQLSKDTWSLFSSGQVLVVRYPSLFSLTKGLHGLVLLVRSVPDSRLVPFLVRSGWGVECEGPPPGPGRVGRGGGEEVLGGGGFGRESGEG